MDDDDGFGRTLLDSAAGVGEARGRHTNASPGGDAFVRPRSQFLENQRLLVKEMCFLEAVALQLGAQHNVDVMHQVVQGQGAHYLPLTVLYHGPVNAMCT
jgi:hypothetical protein